MPVKGAASPRDTAGGRPYAAEEITEGCWGLVGEGAD